MNLRRPAGGGRLVYVQQSTVQHFISLLPQPRNRGASCFDYPKVLALRNVPSTKHRTLEGRNR
jgi:hypothetical protein